MLLPLPIPFFSFFFFHLTNIWTQVCASHNSSSLKTTREHWVTWQSPTTRRLRKNNKNIDSGWVYVARLSSLLLADHFVTTKCYLAMRSRDQGKNREWLALEKNQDGKQDSQKEYFIRFSSVQSLSRVWLFVTPWTAACQASLSITNSWSLLKLMSVESVIPSNHLILCRPLLLPPSIFPSIRVFSNESALHIRWLKYWSFSFSISLSNDFLWYRLVGSPCSPRVFSWTYLLKSLLQHHSSKASMLE